MKMTGMIFSNIYDSCFGELTRHRTLASLPFGGRYRLIDFVLSNMSNSGIVEIGIVTKYNYQSLMDHLGSCEEWDLNRKNNGRVFILPPYGTGQTNVYEGKLQALEGAKRFIERCQSDYVLLCDCNVICNIDYDLVLKEHIKSEAEVTVIAHRVGKHPENHLAKFVVTPTESGEVADLFTNATYGEQDLCGLGMFIINKELLLREVAKGVSHGRFHLEQDLIQRNFLEGTLKVNLYEFKHKVLMCNDVSSYFKNSLALLDEQARQEIFSLENPIYTKVRDDVPSVYDPSAEVTTSLIADGCRIQGQVIGSVLFRNVLVEQGARVENSIVMQGSVIRSGAMIKNVILDKSVEVTQTQTLVGSPDIPMIVQKGYKV